MLVVGKTAATEAVGRVADEVGEALITVGLLATAARVTFGLTFSHPCWRIPGLNSKPGIKRINSLRLSHSSLNSVTLRQHRRRATDMRKSTLIDEGMLASCSCVL